VNIASKISVDEAAGRSRSIKRLFGGLSSRQRLSLAAVPVALVAGIALIEFRGAPVTAAPPPPTVTVRRGCVAERVGFEPTVRLPVRRISSAVLSTTQPPLR
jgi:hypothetical protein